MAETHALKAAFFCFTDNPDNLKKLNPKSRYEIIGIKRTEADPWREARKIKVLRPKILSGFTYTVWVDASAEIRVKNAQSFVRNALGRKPIAVFRHPRQDGISGELLCCLACKLDVPEVMISQVAKYYRDGMPDKLDLVATGVVVRKNSEQAMRFCRAWWHEISKHSRRDQLSFGYVAWKNKIPFALFDDMIWKPPLLKTRDFTFYRHGR